MGRTYERDVIAEVRSATVSLPPPPRRTKTKDSYLQSIQIGAVYVSEVSPPDGVEPVDWMLLTNVKISTFDEIVQVVTWYSYRWQIEVFHKILKSGCTVEACRLSTADRLIRYIVMMSVVAWRIHWLTLVSRQSPETPCTVVFADSEWKSLCVVVAKKTMLLNQRPSVKTIVRMVAGLGGFLGRKMMVSRDLKAYGGAGIG